MPATPPIYRVTYFFEHLQPPDQGITLANRVSHMGWTESWYYAAANLEAAVVFAVNPDNYLGRRMACTPNTVICTWARVSNVANQRETKTVALTFFVTGARPAPAQTTCALLVDFTVLPTAPGDNAHHRRWLLRGLRANMLNGNLLVEGVALTNVLSFLNFLGRGQGPQGNAAHSPWLIRFQPNPPTLVPLLDVRVSPASANRLSITTQAPLVVVSGDRVRIRGVDGFAAANRLWTYRTTTGANQYQLGPARREIRGGPATVGTAQVIGYQYQAADQYLVVGMRTKSTGRPFRLTRGRRSTR